MFAEIEHAGADTGDARAVSRHRHRSRQARLQRQDDRARVGARRRFRPVAEDPAHRQRRGSVDAPAARDLHRQACAPSMAPPPASSTSRCCSTCCRAASTGARAQTLLQWAFIEDAVSRMDCARVARRNRTAGRRAAQRGVRARRVVGKAMSAKPGYRRRLRRATRVARLPDPRAPGAWQAAGVPRQRGFVAAARASVIAAVDDYERHAPRQRASRRAPAEPGSHGDVRTRARTRARVRECRLHARSHLHARHHRIHQPRGAVLRAPAPAARRRDPAHRARTSRQHRAVAARGRADRRRRQGRAHGPARRHRRLRMSPRT